MVSGTETNKAGERVMAAVYSHWVKRGSFTAKATLSRGTQEVREEPGKFLREDSPAPREEQGQNV
jgi:hypothetical protein